MREVKIYIFNVQCRSNVYHGLKTKQALTERMVLLQQRNMQQSLDNNPAFCTHSLLCGNCYKGDNVISRGQKDQ